MPLHSNRKKVKDTYGRWRNKWVHREDIEYFPDIIVDYKNEEPQLSLIQEKPFTKITEEYAVYDYVMRGEITKTRTVYNPTYYPINEDILMELDLRYLTVTRGVATIWQYKAEELGFKPVGKGEALALSRIMSKYPETRPWILYGPCFIIDQGLISKYGNYRRTWNRIQWRMLFRSPITGMSCADFLRVIAMTVTKKQTLGETIRQYINNPAMLNEIKDVLVIDTLGDL